MVPVPTILETSTETAETSPWPRDSTSPGDPRISSLWSFRHELRAEQRGHRLPGPGRWNGGLRFALAEFLDDPMGTVQLESLVRPGARVAIVVDDPSRWTPVGEALPIVLSRLLNAGVRREDVTISVGVGRHHEVDPASMRRRVGDEIAATYTCFSPPVDDLSAYVDLGTTSQGIPVRVFRPVVEADLRILIGSVLPHLQAGFGGGYKLIFPGTSHRSTLAALHRQGLAGSVDASGLIGGDAAENPMRQAIHEAATLLGPCFSVSHLIGATGPDPPGPVGPARYRPGPPGGRGPPPLPGSAGGAGRHPCCG